VLTEMVFPSIIVFSGFSQKIPQGKAKPTNVSYQNDVYMARDHTSTTIRRRILLQVL